MRRRSVTIAVVVGVLLAGILRLRGGDKTVPPDLVPVAQEREAAAPVPVGLQGAGRVARESRPATEASPDMPTMDATAAAVPDLEGVVLDPTGSPSPGTEVVARYETQFGGWFATTMTKSDANGRFSFALPSLRMGVTTVDLTCGGLEGRLGTPRETIGTETAGVVFPQRNLVLRLVDAAYIRGVAIDDVGEPVPSVRIVATGFAGAIHSHPSVAVTTDAAGHFVFGPLRPGVWTLVTTPQSGWTYAEMTAVAPADGATFRFTRGLTLRGHLVGPEAEGFEVLWILPRGAEGLRQGAVTSDATGDFLISGLPDAPVRLFARRIGDARYGLVEDARPSTRTLDVPLVTGEAIEGTCDGYSGRVIAHNGDLQHEGRAEGGTFRIVGLPRGRWTLRRVVRQETSNGALEFEDRSETGAESGTANVALR